VRSAKTLRKGILNMKRLPAVFCISFVVIPLVGACNKPSTAASAALDTANGSAGSAVVPPSAPQNDRDAIIEAIKKHLSDNKGINMAAMDMNVGNVAINGDQAQADTDFRLKQGGTSMLIKYFLQRHPGGWIVLRNETSSAGQFAHPPMDKNHSGPAATPTIPDLKDLIKDLPPPKSD
jgi:hypothetical protein